MRVHMWTLQIWILNAKWHKHQHRLGITAHLSKVGIGIRQHISPRFPLANLKTNGLIPIWVWKQVALFRLVHHHSPHSKKTKSSFAVYHGQWWLENKYHAMFFPWGTHNHFWIYQPLLVNQANFLHWNILMDMLPMPILDIYLATNHSPHFWINPINSPLS